jgi:hypothetical protein
VTGRTVQILIVDDEDADGRALGRELPADVRAEVSHPRDLVADDLEGLDLVLVDYDLGQWATSEKRLGPSRRPLNGLALASVLREHIELAAGSRPVAVALYSAQTGRISAGLSDDVREHAIARLHNLEWVFEKKLEDVDTAPLADRVAELARSVRQLPESWPERAADTWGPVQRLLDWHDKQPAADQCWQEVRDCRPPVRELAHASNGLALLRWLAHRVLPYPCFLSDDRAVAWRFGIPVAELRTELASTSELSASLNTVSYKGALANYVGPRWWRAGINGLAAAWQGSGSAELHGRLEALAGRPLESLGVEFPVACINTKYEVLDDPIDAQDAVRVAPDDWPPFADQAWTRRDWARTRERLRPLVLPEDADLLRTA